MVDSGAALNLINKDIVEKYQIPIQPCTPPIKIKAIDDAFIGEGITHQTKTLTLKVGLLHQESITLYVADSPKHEAILGFPWLSVHDPDISWYHVPRGTVKREIKDEIYKHLVEHGVLPEVSEAGVADQLPVSVGEGVENPKPEEMASIDPIDLPSLCNLLLAIKLKELELELSRQQHQIQLLHARTVNA
ncbi:Retrotransposon-derived PEG10 [Labeo rohita]|uniref:Retrotransposon-derived PEG10 n=1 Tax=Labeo rohita TaxID=84645 RepID=A0A498MDA6_LABRO|nr:Retrotransposon-derived PEG10 [Labeo rohita]